MCETLDPVRTLIPYIWREDLFLALPLFWWERDIRLGKRCSGWAAADHPPSFPPDILLVSQRLTILAGSATDYPSSCSGSTPQPFASYTSPVIKAPSLSDFECNCEPPRMALIIPSLTKDASSSAARCFPAISDTLEPLRVRLYSAQSSLQPDQWGCDW